MQRCVLEHHRHSWLRRWQQYASVMSKRVRAWLPQLVVLQQQHAPSL